MIDLEGYVPVTTELVLGTKKFKFTQLSMANIASFRADIIKKKKVLNEERRARLIEDAEKIGGIDPMELLKLTDTTMTEEEIEEAMESVEGIGELAKMSLYANHQGLSSADVMEIITVADMEAINKAMFGDQAEDGEAEKKTRRTRQRQ